MLCDEFPIPRVTLRSALGYVQVAPAGRKYGIHAAGGLTRGKTLQRRYY